MVLTTACDVTIAVPVGIIFYRRRGCCDFIGYFALPES